MSIHASRKFLKEFAVMTGFTYQEYLAEMIIGYCSHRNGELTKDQFEELLVQAAHSTDLILDESIGDNYRMIIDSQKRRIFKQNLRRLDEIQQDEGKYSLCFPSISTAAYNFDIPRAAKVATTVIKEFLSRYPQHDIQLILVDINESVTLKAFREEKLLQDITDPRYIIQAANITLLRDYGIQSWYLVNASNPSFRGGGSGTNRAIHAAAGSSEFNLEKETKKLYHKHAQTAKAYPVDLKPGSPLREYQGVRTVIHVVGPNMSPKRPRYLGNNYEEGERLLRKAYQSVFRTFMKKTGLDVDTETSSEEESLNESPTKSKKKNDKHSDTSVEIPDQNKAYVESSYYSSSDEEPERHFDSDNSENEKHKLISKSPLTPKKGSTHKSHSERKTAKGNRDYIKERSTSSSGVSRSAIKANSADSKNRPHLRTHSTMEFSSVSAPSKPERKLS